MDLDLFAPGLLLASETDNYGHFIRQSRAILEHYWLKTILVEILSTCFIYLKYVGYRLGLYFASINLQQLKSGSFSGMIPSLTLLAQSGFRSSQSSSHEGW